MTTTQQLKDAATGVGATLQVAGFMIAVALVSVFAVGIYNLVSARDVLQGVSQEQLSDVATSSFDSVALRLDAYGDLAAMLASDRGVVRALGEFDSAYAELPATPTGGYDADLVAAYDAEFADAAAADDDPSPAELVPESAQAQYLQYWYIAQNPNADRAMLDRALDESSYSDVHESHHPTLRAVVEGANIGDLVFVNLEGTVVYSVDKNIDVGTNLVSGPHNNSVLARAAMDVGPDTGVGQARATDLEFYAPALYAPTAFIVSPASDGESVIGYVLMEIPANVLTELVTNDSGWTDAGLGETGEVYLVGDDLMMRTESRLWLEDPDAFLSETSAANGEQVAENVETRRTSVLTQPVATQAVEGALATGSFDGTVDDYLGREAITIAASIDVGDGQWVVVGSFTTEEAYASLDGYVFLVIVMALVLVPLVAILAVIAARRMLRPVDDLVEVAIEVGDGRTDIAAPSFGHDEFGDVAERLNAVVEVMRTQNDELSVADAETTEILLASMPAEIADRIKDGDTAMRQELRYATIVVVTVGDPSADDPVGQDSLADRTVQIAGRLTGIAKEQGVEVLHTSTKQYVFALGLDVEAPEANKGVAFASEVQATIEGLADELAMSITCRIGLSAGQVVQGIVGTERMAFTVWGVPLNDATDLSMASAPGEIIVDANVAGRLDDDWSLSPMDDLVDLSGGRLDGWRVLGRNEVAQT